MTRPLRVLIVQDSTADTAPLLAELARAGYEPTHEQVQTEPALLSALEKSTWDLVLAEYQLAGFDVLNALGKVEAKGLDVPFLVVSGTRGEDRAVAAIKAGAHDYILEDSLSRLGPAVGSALREAAARRERRRAEASLRQSESRLRAILQADPECVKILSLEGKLLEMNPAGLRMIQAESLPQVAGLPAIDLVTPEYRAAYVDLQRRVARGESGTLEFEIIGLKGSRRWLETHAVPLRDERQEVTALLGITRDITERKRAEQLLRDSHERFERVARATNDAIWEWNVEAGDAWWNEAMFEILGCTPGECAPSFKIVAQTIHPEDRDRVLSAYQAAIEKRDCVWVDEYRLRRKDGSTVHVFNRTYFIFNAEGKPQRMGGALLDITKRRTAEQLLRVSHERFELIARATDDALWEWNIETNEQWWNDSMWQILGYRPGEVVPSYEVWAGKIHPEDRADVLAGLQAAIGRRDNAWSEEYRFRLDDGSVAYVLDRAYTIFNALGKPVRMVGAIMDITKRRLAEEALRESESSLARAQKIAHLGVWEWDLLARLGTWSDETYRIFGLAPRQFIPTSEKFTERVHPEDRARVSAAVDETLATGVDYNVEHRIVRPDGEIRFVSERAEVIRDERGKAVRLLGTVLDITERKTAEEALAESREQLRSLAAYVESVREEERTRMAREVHDVLGQSLTGLKMDLAWVSARLPAGQPALLERARAMSALADETIQTVRKIASDLRPGVLDNLGLVAAIEWQAQEFQSRTRIDCAFQSQFDDVDLNPDLATAVFRIFQETLTNVARHARATAVTVTLQEQAGQVVLEVQDNGQGIEENQKTNPRSLGLLGMRERAFLLGGEIRITGTPGHGTKVTLTIPMTKQTQPKAQA